jgi:hypothetical protein
VKEGDGLIELWKAEVEKGGGGLRVNFERERVERAMQRERDERGKLINREAKERNGGKERRKSNERAN